MMTYEAFRDALFALARENGAQAETYCVEGDEFQVRIDAQEVDTYTVSRSRGLGLRVQKDGHDGSAYTEVFDEPETLFARALDNASIISNTDDHPMNGPQTYSPVAEPENPTMALSEAEKIEVARALEREALAADPKVRRVAYDAVSTSHETVRIANTLGLCAEESSSLSYCYVSPVLEDGGEIHDDGAFYINADTLRVADCAKEAVARAAAQFGASPVPQGKYRILWQNESLADLLGAFAPMFSADNVQRGLSPLRGREGEAVMDAAVTIVDDPLYPKYPRAFDAEGTPSVATRVVEAGKLTSLLHNLKTAKKAGVASTSNASRAGAASPVGVSPSQLYIVPGDKSFDELVASLGDGLIIRDISGLHAGVSAVSGDFSLIAKGALVENGRIVRAVEQITVSGSFLDMLSHVVAVGSDLKFALPSGGVCGAPSILFDGLMVAGK